MRVTDVTARVLAACAGLLFTAPALAQSPGYPGRPVKMIVPFAAAGPTDVVARLIALKLSEKFGQQFYIENMAGAGGNLGMGAAARAPADGYTILFVSSSYTVNPSLYAKPPYDPDKDFAPVTKAAGSPNGLFVHPSIPAKSVKELVELIKANPGKYTFASPGIGTTPHLSSELFKAHLRTGFRACAVPGRRSVDTVGRGGAHADVLPGDSSRDPVGEGRQAARAYCQHWNHTAVRCFGDLLRDFLRCCATRSIASATSESKT
jgi:tripartite-type tricarboxylate transporter receptor subunit TctC